MMHPDFGGDEEELRRHEILTRFADIEIFADHLENDDYLWMDGSADYVRYELRKLIKIIRGTSAC